MAKGRNQSDGLSGLRPDVAAAAARLGSRLRDPRDLSPVAAYVGEDETVGFVALASYERGVGVVVLTEARLVFFHLHLTNPSLDLPLGSIETVTTSSGMSTGEVALQVGEEEKVVALSRVVKGDLEPLADAIRRAVDAAPDVPPPAPAGAGAGGAIDPFEAMAKLSALRDAGVLTEAEFVAKKKDLLDRL